MFCFLFVFNADPLMNSFDAFRLCFQHGHSHFTPADPPQENSVQNGDARVKSDSVVLTNIATVSTDKSGPAVEPQQVPSATRGIFTEKQ